MSTPPLTRRHHQRLREIYRSAGWPCHDALEVDLLAAGLLQRVFSDAGHETLRVTDEGVAMLARVFERNREARSAHEALVERIARAQVQAGRLAWRGLALRVPLPRPAEPDAVDWVVACPDVFSIRRSSREDWLEPVVHEIKVRRADLRADLRNAAKRQAYLGMAGACWYVLGRDARGRAIGDADDVPPECGVLQAAPDGLHVQREAPRRALPRLPFHVWMALAGARPVTDDDAPPPLL